jgi:2-oxoglutarate dehydrogenase E1 component
MVEAPIFHVNGDDPEAVLFVTRLALDFRQTFHKDVVVDIVCFRKLGHNEQDEPAVTQPLMYKKISQHPGTRKLYADKLEAQKVIAEGEGEALIKKYRDTLDAGQQSVSPVLSNFKSKFAVDWAPFLGSKWTDAADTNVPLEELRRLSDRVTTVPEGFAVHPTVGRVIEARKQMAAGKLPVDWGMAETLAYASLLSNGYDVRLSGQDSGRGTFAHRHAVLHDQDRERWDQGSYIPLQNIGKDQGDFVVIDSVLSEEAVLGFEYGFLHRRAERAGDLGSAVRRLRQRRAGGDGPVHQLRRDQVGAGLRAGAAPAARLRRTGARAFIARLERYLQLCAEHNMQVCVPSNAAQVFHLLRRQMLRPFRKPLIVMTPKSLLRKKEAASSIQELANGSFQTVIPDTTTVDEKGVKRIIACCGKVYYDLATKRIETQRSDVAIIRVEQLYPFPHKQFEAQMKRYSNATEVVWCQEEPQNQGAWYQTAHYFRENMRDDQKLYYAGRPASASPAGGYKARHDERQKALVEQAFGKFK